MDGNSDNTIKSPFYKIITGNISLQIIVTFFSILMYALIKYYFNEAAACAITSGLCIPAYFVMIYIFTWGIWERERNLIMYGHMQSDPSRGIRAGLYAVIPLFILSLVAVLSYYAGFYDSFIGWYRMAAAPFVIITVPLSDTAPYLLPLVCVFCPLAAWFGYHNGLKIYRLWDHLLYPNGVKPKRDNRSSRRGDRGENTHRHI